MRIRGFRGGFAQTMHSVSEETRQKISAANKGEKRPDNIARNKAAADWSHTDEAKAKIAEASRTGGFKGKSHSEATKAEISKAPTGRKPSNETLRKRSISFKKAWARRKAEASGEEEVHENIGV